MNMYRRGLLAGSSALFAQSALAAPPAQQTPINVDPYPVGVLGAELGGTYLQMATDLMNCLDGPVLRIVPLVGRGSLRNLEDLRTLRGVDLAFTAADAIDYAIANNLVPDAVVSLRYVAKLYENEHHLLAPTSITTVQDLRNKRVSVDLIGSGSATSAAVIWPALGLEVEEVHQPQAAGRQQLIEGKVDALLYSAGKPISLFRSDIPPGFHFVPIPLTGALADRYVPGFLTHDDYPNLIPEGETVETTAVPVVLACYNWPVDSDRYRGLVRFTEAFTQRFADLQHPPYHPKWRDVNLSAEVPGWTRFVPMQRVLAAQNSPKPVTGFDAFLASIGWADATGVQRQTFKQFYDHIRAR